MAGTWYFICRRLNEYGGVIRMKNRLEHPIQGTTEVEYKDGFLIVKYIRCTVYLPEGEVSEAEVNKDPAEPDAEEEEKLKEFLKKYHTTGKRPKEYESE